jgi:two-component system, chemotaxis family, chemotaxis protein CheY
MNPHRARILVVDDNQPLRLLVRTLMEKIGVQSIDEAVDGAAAVELLLLNHYDLVLADWNMPNISGLQLVQIIQEMPAKERPPVVLISCDVSRQRSVEALGAGVSGLVSKPFVNATLCTKVVRMLSTLAPVYDITYSPPSAFA